MPPPPTEPAKAEAAAPANGAAPSTEGGGDKGGSNNKDKEPKQIQAQEETPKDDQDETGNAAQVASRTHSLGQDLVSRLDRTCPPCPQQAWGHAHRACASVLSTHVSLLLGFHGCLCLYVRHRIHQHCDIAVCTLMGAIHEPSSLWMQANGGEALDDVWEVDVLAVKRQSKLGKGSSGDVYLGKDMSHDRKFALKIVPITLKTSDVQPVVDELRELYGSRHPNVAAFHGAAYDSDSSSICIAFEVCILDPLRAVCSRKHLRPQP